MNDEASPSGEHEADAFHDFIEDELNLDGDADLADPVLVIPPAVIQAAMTRLQARLDTQAQALADHPDDDLWSQALDDEHMAVVQAVERHFTDVAEPDVLRFSAAVALYLHASRGRVLDDPEVAPYIRRLHEREAREAAKMLLPPATLPPWFTRKYVPQPPPARRMDVLDRVLVVAIAVLLILLLYELLARIAG